MHFIPRVDPKLRIPANQIYFPSSKNIDRSDDMILEARRDPSANGAQIVYGDAGLTA